MDNMDTLAKTIGGDRFGLCGDEVGRDHRPVGLGGRGGVEQGGDLVWVQGFARVLIQQGWERSRRLLPFVTPDLIRGPAFRRRRRSGIPARGRDDGILGGRWWPYLPRHPGLGPGSTLRRGEWLVLLAVPLRPGGPRNESGVTLWVGRAAACYPIASITAARSSGMPMPPSLEVARMSGCAAGRLRASVAVRSMTSASSVAFTLSALVRTRR